MSKTTIKEVFAWEALDSRGDPTVACEVRLVSGDSAAAIAPAGASTGLHEAPRHHDGGNRYGGSGASGLVATVNDSLGPRVEGLDATDQEKVDAALTEPGAAALAISIATARAAAAAHRVPLHEWIGGEAGALIPMPMVNIISGGAHSKEGVDFQDFLALPVGAASFSQAIEWAWRVRRSTAEIASDKGLIAGLVADEGGLGPSLPSNRAAVEMLATGIATSGLELGTDVSIGVDVAASQFHAEAGYSLAREGRVVSSAEMIDELERWLDEFAVRSIEDPLAEDDWDGWRKATSTLGRAQVLGDDFFVTNAERLQRGIDSDCANAILVKPNQAGTLSAAAAVVRQARKAGYATVVSARSGDTEEDWLADLAVGWRAGQIKVGSTTRSERTAKWNRLLRLEARLGPKAEFAGAAALAPLSPR